jgi:hypothetical protein
MASASAIATQDTGTITMDGGMPGRSGIDQLSASLSLQADPAPMYGGVKIAIVRIVAEPTCISAMTVTITIATALIAKGCP